MATKKTKTVRPSGLTLTRNRYAFTLRWKIADDNYKDGQQLQYYNPSTKKWVGVKISNKQTQQTVAIDSSKFYPNTKIKMTGFKMRVRGNRSKYTVENSKTKKKTTYSPSVSEWANREFNIKIPMYPSLSATLSSEVSNETTFTWTQDFRADIHEMAYDVLWQSILVPNDNEARGAVHNWSSRQLGWQTGTSGSSSSRAIREESELLASGSYTRWFRVCSRGPAGDSAWNYAKHVYAKPNQASIVANKTSVTASAAGGYTCKVTWRVDAPIYRPIDYTVVQYTFATPVNGLRCPDGASWTNASTTRDTSGEDATAFSIGGTVDDNQCLFVRVNTYHDHAENYTSGAPAMMVAGLLSEPTGLTVQVDSDTRRATVRATNNALPDNAYSFLAVMYKSSANTKGFVIGVILHGQDSVVLQLPSVGGDVTENISVKAVLGTYKASTSVQGVTSYTITEWMRSVVVDNGGAIPKAPTNVTLSKTATDGTIRVDFDWAWSGAVGAEISWADNENAWLSTSQPKTYLIDTIHAPSWYLVGLTTGKTWYVRVRFASGDNTYGAYSETKSIDLSAAPSIPVLTLSDGVITQDGRVTASWTFETSDGSEQAFAEVAEAITESGTTTYQKIAQTTTAKSVTIKASDRNWQTGESHALVVRVASSSGRESDGWSNPVYINIAEPIDVSITQTSLVDMTLEEGESTRTIKALTDIPMTATITGAGAGGITTLVIERAEDYQVDRPDETDFYGFAGETIVSRSYIGEEQQTIDLTDLVGSLDDGASYNLIATAQDNLGQKDSVTLPFEVHWANQAKMPTATVTIDEEEMIAILTPSADTPATGDVCDIYRLSVDRPELIYPDAQFGTAYVDPYPAIGEFGGHRFVYKTKNGDYITEDNRLAIYDTRENEGDVIDSDYTIIDFDGGRIQINRNLDVDNKWKKDFEETQYLGGSVVGDWNPAISREASVSTVAVSILDGETIQAMRRLAVHAGVCHVRTSDGSSYNANVEVSDRYDHKNGRQVISYDLSITRIDPEEYDGMTLEEWNEIHPVEDENP